MWKLALREESGEERLPLTQLGNTFQSFSHVSVSFAALVLTNVLHHLCARARARRVSPSAQVKIKQTRLSFFADGLQIKSRSGWRCGGSRSRRYELLRRHERRCEKAAKKNRMKWGK